MFNQSYIMMWGNDVTNLLDVWQHSFPMKKYHSCLIHLDLVTPLGDKDLGQHWLRWWVIAWWHQAIPWASDDQELCHQMVSLGHSELMLNQDTL